MAYKTIFNSKDIKWTTVLRWFFVCLVYILLIGIIAGLLAFIYFAKDLPQPEFFSEIQVSQPTRLYDRTGKTLLYTLGSASQENVDLEKMPKDLINAVIASEDANFYNHQGIDPNGILRSLRINFARKELGVGGSTITQQLIRTSLLSTEKTIPRKIKEIILSLELERRYTKDQIIEWYLNRVPYCHNMNGVQQASKTYFGKTVTDLDLAESSLLAAMIQRPCYFSPFGGNLEDLTKRRDNYVLPRMVGEHFITQEQAGAAKKEKLAFAKDGGNLLAPHFSLYVRDYLLNEFGEDFLKENGLKVYTTLDWALQEQAEKAVKATALQNIKYNAHNAALVALDPKNGQILSLVGSKDFWATSEPSTCESNCLFDPMVNMVTYGKRQPGSSFKPFAYVTAFQKGFDDKTIVKDELTNFGTWGGKDYIPKNYDGLFRGDVTLRDSLAQSLNIPAVKVLLYMAGLDDTIKTAQNLGLTTLNPPFGPSIVLGGWEVRLIEMASAYGAFATEGNKVPYTPILKIEDANGNIIKEFKSMPEKVLDTQACRVLNDVLSDNNARAPIFGYRSTLYFDNFKVAVKTGTSNDSRDGWVIGYTPNIVVGVWVGNNNNSPTKKISEVLAGPIFHNYLQYYLLTSGLNQEFNAP